MSTVLKYVVAILVAIVCSIAVVALSRGAYVLTGSLAVRWVVYFLLLIPLWVGMWKLGTKLGKM